MPYRKYLSASLESYYCLLKNIIAAYKLKNHLFMRVFVFTILHFSLLFKVFRGLQGVCPPFIIGWIKIYLTSKHPVISAQHRLSCVIHKIWIIHFMFVISTIYFIIYFFVVQHYVEINTEKMLIIFLYWMKWIKVYKKSHVLL